MDKLDRLEKNLYGKKKTQCCSIMAAVSYGWRREAAEYCFFSADSKDTNHKTLVTTGIFLRYSYAIVKKIWEMVKINAYVCQ